MPALEEMGHDAGRASADLRPAAVRYAASQGSEALGKLAGEALDRCIAEPSNDRVHTPAWRRGFWEGFMAEAETLIAEREAVDAQEASKVGCRGREAGGDPPGAD